MNCLIIYFCRWSHRIFLFTVCIPHVFNVIGRVNEIYAGAADMLTNDGDENFFPNPGAPEEGKPDKFLFLHCIHLALVVSSHRLYIDISR